MSSPTCEDTDLYAKRKDNLRFFLDHLPSHPCHEPPNFDLCTVCFKINFDVARECPIYKKHQAGILDPDKEGIHVEISRAVDLDYEVEEEEASIPEEIEKEFPLFEFSTPTVDTKIYEEETETEVKVKPKRKVKAKPKRKAKGKKKAKPERKAKGKKKAKPKRKAKGKKKAKPERKAKGKKKAKPKKKAKGKKSLVARLKGIYKKANILPYDPEEHSDLLKDVQFCMWKATDDDPNLEGSVLVDQWNDLYDNLDGVEPEFWKFMERFLGKGPETTKGAPVFIFDDDWAGVINISKKKGIRIHFDYNRGALSDRIEVLDAMIDALSTLRKKAKAKGKTLKSKTKSKAYWEETLEEMLAKEVSGADVMEIGTLSLKKKEKKRIKREKPRPVKKVVKKPVSKPVSATEGEDGEEKEDEEPELAETRTVGPEEGKQDTGTEGLDDLESMDLETDLDRKAPVKPERQPEKPSKKGKSSVPPLYASLGHLKTKKEEDEKE